MDYHDASDPFEVDPCRIVTGTRQIGGPSVWIILFEPVEVEASNPDYVLELSEFYCNSYCYTSDGKGQMLSRLGTDVLGHLAIDIPVLFRPSQQLVKVPQEDTIS